MKYFAWWALLAPAFCLTVAAASPALSRHTDFRAALHARALLQPDGRFTGAQYQAALRTRALMLRSQTGTATSAVINWTELGPGNVGGRINAIWIDPANNQHLLAGSGGGGLWQSNDGGSSWSAVSEFPGALTIGAMTSLPDGTLLVGTGDAFTAAGDGIFSSSNGGATWSPLAATAPQSAGAFWALINSIAISNGAILAATGPQGGGNGGIARSTDGGQTWIKVWTGSTSGTGGSMDVAVDPNNSNAAVADDEAGGVVYSTDGGVTWTAGTGLPDTSGARVSVAFDPSVAGSVYALVDNNNGTTPSGEVYHSTNGGSSWSLLAPTSAFSSSGTPSGALCDGSECQGWYDNVILVEPHAVSSSPTIIVGGIDVFASTNGGSTWTEIGGYGVSTLHPDQHALAYDKSSSILYVGNDGGFYKRQGPSTWQAMNEGLAVTQFYSATGHRGVTASQNVVNGAPITPILAGAQDNGTLLYEGYSSGGAPQPDNWVQSFGGDGGFTQVDPADGNDLYGEYVYLYLYRSSNGGNTSQQGYSSQPPDNSGNKANFIAPFALVPNGGAASTQMLAGGASLWLGSNIQTASPLWTQVNGAGMPASSANSNYASAIAVDPANSNDVWVGYDDGEVWHSLDVLGNAVTWTRAGAATLPSRAVNSLWIVPGQPNTVYATFDGYPSTAGDSNVWMTTDGGVTWANLGPGLPPAPVYSLVTHPGDPQVLYAGTLTGVYVSSNDGATWSASSVGPANVEVRQLTWFDTSNVEAPTLLAATYGRGAWLGSPGYNPTPTLTSISPSEITVGSSSSGTVSLIGSGFVQGVTTATFDGSPMSVSFQSATELQATIPPGFLSVAGVHTLIVSNPAPGGGTSAGAKLTVANPAPVVTSISPPSVQKGAAATVITVTGSGFVPGSTVDWNDNALPTTYVSATSLTATIPASDLATGTTAQVIVVTAPPGGGTSAAATFTVESPGGGGALGEISLALLLGANLLAWRQRARLRWS